MSQVIEATFDGKAFHPVNALELPSDIRYRLIVEPLPIATSEDVWGLLANAAGSVEASEDWSAQHDHYLYGTSKRAENE
jgi:hypothetical protein